MNQNIVTEPSSNIRALARTTLAENWKVAVIASAVYMIALIVPAMILDILFGGETGTSPLSGLYNFLVAGPFTVGYTIFCLNVFRGKEVEAAQVFYGFEKFFKALGLYFMMGLFVALWTLLFIIPGIIAAYRYSQAFIIMVDHPEYSIMQCLSESKRIMIGNKMKFFCLEISFIGWGFLAIIIMVVISTAFAFSNSYIMMIIGIIIGLVGYFWLLPYIYVANVAFYELATGHLRPGIIEVEPLHIEENKVKNEANPSTENDENRV